MSKDIGHIDVIVFLNGFGYCLIYSPEGTL